MRIEPGGRAAVYLRISQDRTGQQAGIGRQREDCLAHAARLGFADPIIFVDNDVSAFDGGRRPGYDALVREVAAGVDHVIVWHVDRLYRRPKELEDLLSLVKQHPLRIEAVRGGGMDLNTAEGRLLARQLVAIAAYESGHRSDRVKRANRQAAEEGAWHGPARYGYGAGGTLIPEQAAVIREIADRFLAGQSLRSIAAWLNRSGIPPQRASSGTAGRWYPYTVRSILASARISGQRSYAPDRRQDPPEGREILGLGVWEAIITPDETARIRAMLGDPSRRPHIPATPSLLGGIARCGKCGAGLVVSGHRPATGSPATRRYTCRRDPTQPERGGLSIDATRLDDHITQHVLRRLARPRPSSGTESVASLLQRIVEIHTRLDHVGQDLRDGLISPGEHRAGLAAAEEAIQHAERRLVATGGATALYGAPIGDPDGLHRWWRGLEVADKRAVITTVINTLRIAPGKPGRRFDPTRIRITRRP